jgi:hypothetical protein
MTDAPTRLTRKHDAADIMAAIVAKRLVEHLERSGFVVMKLPPAVGAAALGRGYEHDRRDPGRQRG